ncbi:MAG TPA: carbon monoxide dehydrogenase subunit G [Rhizomicrobium sp.]|jgi:hypothetical protein
MDFTGRYSIPAPPQAVWESLNDPDVLRSCIPGCERLERVAPDRYEAAVIVRVGPLRAAFRATILQTEIDAPRRCVLTGEGQGGAAGFARGEAEVLLASQDGATSLSYTARATIGGKLAQIAQRFIDGAAKQIADDFFGRFAMHISTMQTRRAVSPENEIVVAPEAPVAIPELPAARDGLAPEIWVVGLIAIIIVLLAVFGVVL